MENDAMLFLVRVAISRRKRREDCREIEGEWLGAPDDVGGSNFDVLVDLNWTSW